MRITLSDIFQLDGAVIYSPDNFKSVSSVSIDTRTIKKNSLFVAIKGAKFDGHNFVNDAVNKGASAILINRNRLKNFDKINVPIITVPNTTLAYGELAYIWRSKLKAVIISITGSNGKTSTKEILATLLSEKFKVEKTDANNNNHIGVPLTILSTRSNCQILILEHGTNHFNEIQYTSQIANPDLGMITNIGDSHLEYLIDRNGVYKEKSALYNSTMINDGAIFVNNDDPIIRKNSTKIKNKVTFGLKGNCDVKGKIVGFKIDGRTELNVTYGNKNFKVVLPIYGKSNAKNVLSAIAIAQHLKLSMTQIKSGVGKLNQVPGRLETKVFNKLMIIDDTYNSNPASMEAAIELLTKIKSYKIKTLIIGDMFELGENAEEHHKDLVSLIIKSRIGNVLMLGKMMSNLNKELELTKINSLHFKSRKALSSFILKNYFSNQVILVKGSRGMKMEEFVDQIINKAA